MTKIFLRSASSFFRASAAIRRHIMLEKIDLSKKLDKKEYKALMEELDAKLGRLQRICKEKKIPVAIVFEGLGAAVRRSRGRDRPRRQGHQAEQAEQAVQTSQRHSSAITATSPSAYAQAVTTTTTTHRTTVRHGTYPHRHVSTAVSRATPATASTWYGAQPLRATHGTLHSRLCQTAAAARM